MLRLGCRSGCRDCPAIGNNNEITCHSFPIRNAELRKKWVKTTPREDHTPTKHSKLCSPHFQLSDFLEERQDTIKWSRSKSE